MANIKILKHSSVIRLKNEIADNLTQYEKGTIKKLIAPPSYSTRETSIVTVGSDSGILNPKSAERLKDIENCLFISQYFGNLSPMQAADERVWTYATHITFLDYVLKRWPIPTVQNSNESDEDFKNRKVKHIRMHFFGNSNREIIRDNAISRLWWMGYIAKTCSEHSYNLPPQPNRTFTHQRILEILLKKSDVRANILERPNLNMSKEIFIQIINLLDKDDNREENNTLFDRSNFRSFMKHLNRIGGMKVLNALPADSLSDLFHKIRNEIVPASAVGSS